MVVELGLVLEDFLKGRSRTIGVQIKGMSSVLVGELYI